MRGTLPNAPGNGTIQTGVDSDFCGCCGIECRPGAAWCINCEPHIDPQHVAPWHRTYYAQHGVPCPYQIEPDPLAAFAIGVMHLAALCAILMQPPDRIAAIIRGQVPSSWPTP